MSTIPTEATIPADVPLLPQPPDWTVADLLDQLGGISPKRVRMTPYPGTATEKDVLDMHDRGGPLCELIDGTSIDGVLSGGTVLPGFEISLRRLFSEPQRSTSGP